MYTHVRQIYYFFKRDLEEMFSYIEVLRMFDILIWLFSMLLQ